MKTAQQVIDEMKQYRDKPKMIHHWEDALPTGSRWFPGCVGDPACPDCEGLGFVRFDLPIHHPDFGKLHLCECVSPQVKAKAAEEEYNKHRPIERVTGDKWDKRKDLQ